MFSSESLCHKPAPGEYPAYAEMYMKHVRDGISVLDQLEKNRDMTIGMVEGLPEETLLYRYAPGKWTIKDILRHLCDDERIYVYRALRFARNDTTVLPGFDQDLFAVSGRANGRRIGDLVQEFASVRGATLTFFAGIGEEDLIRSGIADGNRYTVRALAFHIAGHELHHVDMMRRLYLA